MLYWETGIVEEISSEQEPGLVIELLVRLEDDRIERAILYADLIGNVARGDRVLLNTTSVRLNLGSGGVHFVAALLDQKPAPPTPAPGHIMKLRYTPLQHAVLAVEEEESEDHALFLAPPDLQGMPVLIGELHSMLPIAATWSRTLSSKDSNRQFPAIVYIMTDGGALPIAFSKHVQQLMKQQWLSGTITYGHAYGGKAEAVNKFTALVAAKYKFQAEMVLMMMGPGIVGTGTTLGHSGMELGEIINAVNQLGGMPVVMPRISFHDSRARHAGISHHLISALRYAAATPATIPLPKLDDPQLADKLFTCSKQIPAMHRIIWREPPQLAHIDAQLRQYALPIHSMGRTFTMDPVFFQAICTAVSYAGELR